MSRELGKAIATACLATLAGVIAFASPEHASDVMGGCVVAIVLIWLFG